MPRGRPRAQVSDQRRKDFVQLILTGAQWDEAVKAARIQPQRAIVLLQELHAEGLLDVPVPGVRRLASRTQARLDGVGRAAAHCGAGGVSRPTDIVRVYGADGSTHWAYQTGLRTLCLEPRLAAVRGVRGTPSCLECVRVERKLALTVAKWQRRLRSGRRWDGLAA